MEEQKFVPSVHETTHSHTWMIVLLIGCVALIIALLGLFAYQYYEPQEAEISAEISEVGEDVDAINTQVAILEDSTGSEEFASLLYDKTNYSLPFGSAEIEAYYTTVEKPTSLDNSTPMVTCSALVIVDGPDKLMDALTEDMFGAPPTVVIGSGTSSWNDIDDSTEEKPIKIFVTLDPTFEGELIGCMKWPFNTFVAVE